MSLEVIQVAKQEGSPGVPGIFIQYIIYIQELKKIKSLSVGLLCSSLSIEMFFNFCATPEM